MTVPRGHTLSLWAFRRLAVAVSALCLLAYGSTFLHMAVVQHATCVEHDEIMHAGGQPEARPISTRPSVEAAPEAEHVDDHCLIVATQRRDNASLQVAVAWTAPPDLPVLELREGGSRFVSPPVPLLSLAPKSSPPRS